MKISVVLDAASNPLLANYHQCREFTRHYAKSFYFSSFLLPKEKRKAAYAVYTFCRYADNIVDARFNCEVFKISIGTILQPFLKLLLRY